MSTRLSLLATPIRSQKFLIDSGVYPRLRKPDIVGIRGIIPSPDASLHYQFDQFPLAQYRIVEVETGELDLLGMIDTSNSSRNQSYNGRWSSNSRVQIEWVIPSMESEKQWAKSYIG